MIKSFKDWYICRYGNPYNRSCWYLTRKGWLGCRRSVLEILKSEQINHKNPDIKYILQEVKKLNR